MQTFSELFESFMRYHARDNCRSADKMQWYFDRYMQTISVIPANEITRKDILDLREQLLFSVGRTTANRVIELISSAYNRMIEYEIYDGRNPAKGIRKFKEERRTEYLSQEQFARLYSALKAREASTSVDCILMLLYTGQRRSCVQAMRWEDLDLDNRIWIIPSCYQKNGREHGIALITDAIELLRSRPRDSANPYVFPGAMPGTHINKLESVWHRACKVAGVRLRLHSLRHTMATWLVKSGASIGMTGKVLNHLDIKSTMRYSHLACEDTREPMQRAINMMAMRL